MTCLLVGAFDIYLQLSDEDKVNVIQVKEALWKVFVLDLCKAYKQFSRWTLCPDKAIDEFYAALKELASPFRGIPDRAMTYAFMVGLPAHTEELLLASANVECIPAEHMLGWPRAIINNEKVAATADQPATVKVHPLKPTECLLYCFNCSGPNHLAWHCQLEWPEQHSKPYVRCYKCQKKSHTTPKCSGNREREWGVSTTLALCNAQTSLPVMHVGINGMIRSALVDSGHTCFLKKSSVCSLWERQKIDILMVNTKSMASRGVSSVTLKLEKRMLMVVETLAIDSDL